ncbi:protein-tyrosine phosphatase-like protein [Suillus subaureus]|uniref:protein-tyrosine-phosphatase n=1 Tax=Suillus subaureus TaxID=48587 RepID=A0A9P7EJE9_9AGAM|nr:protein-tyrosine phosphatase-like protein [Suillus subaureus]KAG1823341.1 protein-tyrosine phosphatase-like protein [Suillus subaureus]
MDEVVPGVWIGDLQSALDVKGLKERNIFSILTAMRGKVTIHAIFNRYQVNVDDSANEDVLVHFLPSISFIQNELDKGRGVLVHCMAGISRSATIVAAYLMYSLKLDPESAVDMIRTVRPSLSKPNEGFMEQLKVFHQSSYKFTRRDKATHGDGTIPDNAMFAKHPRTPSDSVPNTPMIVPSRRIRCKMCRQELATREHMLDHGQLGPPTPALPSLSPATSRRPSANDRGTSSRRPSMSLGARALMESLSMSSLSMSALDTDDDHEPDEPKNGHTDDLPPLRVDVKSSRSSSMSMEGLGKDLSDALDASVATNDGPSTGTTTQSETVRVLSPVHESQDTSKTGGPLQPPLDLAAELHSHPKLAALRMPPSLSMTGIRSSISPPILMNPKCSGYFVEPMKWMEPFLESGQLAGKIICPKCSAKLGNYDWAGVCCSCNSEWVTPGFCIHRSKVDEVVMG